MKFPIRLATIEDVDQLVELIHIQLVEHHVQIFPSDLRRGIEAVLFNDQRGIILVALQESEIVGAACVSFLWPLEYGGLAAWLEELYVIPPCREHGLGSELLQSTMQECARRGCAALDLEVEEDHLRVENLYRRFGFKPIHSRRRWVKILQQI